MNIKTGESFLITTDNWFLAPDGKTYKAVWGTVHAIKDSKETLGIKTNAKSTNWYVVIGNMIVAGCQIHYAIQADEVMFGEVDQYDINDNGCVKFTRPSQIYNANQKSEKS